MIILLILIMAESKNQLIVNEFSSLGEIIDGVLTMPTLWSIDSHKNYRYWNIYIGIENTKTNKKINVTKNHINKEELSKDCYGMYWTKSGVEDTDKPIISEKIFVLSGKNKGNKNYTTSFTQAILDARTDYNLKIKKGSQPDKSLLITDGISMELLIKQKQRGTHPWRVFAMALHDISKNDNIKHITYPCKIQPKLDGTLFIIVYHPDIPNKIDTYSRGRENTFGQDHIVNEMESALKHYPGLHVVGELWTKGYGLQDISGISRRQKESDESIKLNFNIFDCFYIDSPNMIFDEREAILSDLMYRIESSNNSKYVKLIETTDVMNYKSLDEKYNSYLDEGLEGAVIRNVDSLYHFGIDKEIRSYTTLKYKPRFDDEWPIVDFKEGKGKEKGAVIWICCENDSNVKKRLNEIIPINERKTFSVTPNIEYSLRYKIYENLTKNSNLVKKIKGSLITISYSTLSKDFLPQQPKAIKFKDLELIAELIN